MPAILFGSISTVADTSELQRQSFNRAFASHGLDWNWDRDDYLAMLETAGGQDRIAQYARSRGEEVDAGAVHATKSSLFQEELAGAALEPRAGVAETIRAAKENGLRVALVTTTSPDNVAALMRAVHASIASDAFDVVVDSSKVERSKPDAAAYAWALDHLGERASDCVAVEDNLDGVRAAEAAGVRCLAFPNQNTAGHDFGDAARVDALDPEHLQQAARNA